MCVERAIGCPLPFSGRNTCVTAYSQLNALELCMFGGCFSGKRMANDQYTLLEKEPVSRKAHGSPVIFSSFSVMLGTGNHSRG